MLIAERDAVISKNQKPPASPPAIVDQLKSPGSFERGERCLLQLLEHVSLVFAENGLAWKEPGPVRSGR